MGRVKQPHAERQSSAETTKLETKQDNFTEKVTAHKSKKRKLSQAEPPESHSHHSNKRRRICSPSTTDVIKTEVSKATLPQKKQRQKPQTQSKTKKNQKQAKKSSTQNQTDITEPSKLENAPSSGKRKTKTVNKNGEEIISSTEETQKKVKRKRSKVTETSKHEAILKSSGKGMSENGEEAMPKTVEEVKREVKMPCDSEANTAVNGAGASAKLVGAHCSIAGGLHKAVEEAVAMGGRAIGLFLRSQRSWTSKPLDPVAAEKFKAACKEHGFSPNSILPHGSYLMNCGSPNPDTLRKSREALLEELQRCEALGLTLYNFHPGSTCGETSVDQCLDSIAEAINWAHQHTKSVVTVVENMSCQGNTVGGRFEELKGIIDRVKDKSRIGICLDTCHAFAAGFDLSSREGFEKFVSDFDSIVGFQYLRAMHLNDSKGEVGCHLDRHENIGKGKIGLEGFRRVMLEPRFDGIPMVLETPVGDYAAEIHTLNNLV